MLEVNTSTAPANTKRKIALDYKRDLCSYGNNTLCISCPLGMEDTFKFEAIWILNGVDMTSQT